MAVAMDDPQSHKALYLGTIRELETKSASDDYYSLVKSSGLLRGLILDGTNLVDAVNRHFKVKCRFDIADVRLYPIRTVCQWHDVCPVAWKKMRSVDRKELLATKCLSFADQQFSIRDVIRACANAKGGVHIGAPRAREEGILDMDEVLSIGGKEASLQSLRSIVTVVLKGLEPLTEAVKVELEKKDAAGGTSTDES
jgi:hypothetical protein